MIAPGIEAKVPLAPRTTLGIGGPARYFGEPADEAATRAMLDWASERALAVTLLGQGSNTVVADGGVDGLVLHLRAEQLLRRTEGDTVRLEVGAGVGFDELVSSAVEQELAGLECLAGIPGTVGACPVQNVGAYGQQVGDRITAVRAIDRRSGKVVQLTREQCGFSYRDSLFKRQPARYVIVAVQLALQRGGTPTLAYRELARRVGSAAPTLAETRRAVLALRRAKSMVIDPADPNHRSVGSFFVNPVVTSAQAEAVRERASALAGEAVAPPSWPSGDGRVKLAAAWLIERAGMPKGYRRGAVAISSRHSLALVNLGGATARALLALASEIRDAVRERLGVTLRPEPRLVGFAPEELAPLLD